MAQVKLEPLELAQTTHPRLGSVWLAFSPRGLIAVDFGVERERFLSHLEVQTGTKIRQAGQAASGAAIQIAEYLSGRRQAFSMRIDWSVLHSDFQRAVLREVARVPYGQTRSYMQIAALIGRPGVVRAIGGANAANPMPLVIPCHRIIGSDGKLHGYGGAGGLRTKAWLLGLESGNRPGVW